MINLRIPPKNPEELYEFFMEVARPPVKSRVVYANGFKYIRENWVTTGYRSPGTTAYQLWFRYLESDPPKWYEIYEKYISQK